VKPFSRLLGVLGVTVVLAAPAGAQTTAIPCKNAPCVMALDWGSGMTSSSYPPDRRYGSGDDFESRFRTAMGAHGYQLREGPIEGAMAMNLRPTMKSKVMCDAMAGINPDMNCTAITGLAVSFTSAEKK